ncbi:MAG: endonuclease [Bacteroides sp.]|nr:endonuclease [Bacteroides sp.]MCM1379761.1 endonuclease [Bacteroides sp.]MCM1445698.1 endonuclease [Prevotella sp.]
MKKALILSALFAALTFGTEAAERNIPAGYYNAMDGKSGASLKSAALSCIKGQKVISYGDKTWEVFADSDVRPDGTWWDIYSDEKRKANSGHSNMNIEHAVANSWWGKTKNDAYKDIHHLFPSDAEANSRKSNYPLGETAKPTWTNGVTIIGKPINGHSGQGGYIYEPSDEYKGDNARVYFYMATRYPDISWRTDNYTSWGIMFKKEAYPTLNEWSQELLLRWTDQDEVSQKEIDRNEAIYKHQKNRNPFVDLPGLEDYIWGDKKNVAFDLKSFLGGESSINSIEETMPFGVETYSGGINIRCEETLERVMIYDMSGRLIVKLTDVSDNTTVTLQSGIYVVTAGRSSRPIKVII